MRRFLSFLFSWARPDADRLDMHTERRQMLVHMDVSGGKRSR